MVVVVEGTDQCPEGPSTYYRKLRCGAPALECFKYIDIDISFCHTFFIQSKLLSEVSCFLYMSTLLNKSGEFAKQKQYVILILLDSCRHSFHSLRV